MIRVYDHVPVMCSSFSHYHCLPPPLQNILLHGSGHVLLTDFDLSYSKGVTTPKIEKVLSKVPKKVGSCHHKREHALAGASISGSIH